MWLRHAPHAAKKQGKGTAVFCQQRKKLNESKISQLKTKTKTNPTKGSRQQETDGLRNVQRGSSNAAADGV